MKNLYHVIPAFAPDYGGVGASIFEMEEILGVYIDPHGCFGQTLYFMDPRAEEYFPNLFSVGIRELDAVTGRDTLFVDKIAKALSYIDAKAVVMMGTPVPMMIGLDFKALEKLVAKKTGVPVIALETDGFRPYCDGQAMLYRRLIEEFAGKTEWISSEPAEVHILGATPLDMWDYTAVEDYKKFLHGCGVTSVACWGRGSGLEAVAGVEYSKLNIAVSSGGLEACRLLHEKYGTPYCVGYPVGKMAEEKWKQKIVSLGKRCESGIEKNGVKSEKIHRVMILGDQISANALRECLVNEYGVQEVDVFTYFTLHEELAEKGDVHLREENELETLVWEREPYDLIIGDGIYRELMPDKEGVYLELSHIGTSGMVHWDNSVNLFGKKGSSYFDKVFAHFKMMEHE